MRDQRLHRHLALWLGRWPGRHTLEVVGSARRDQPGWDTRIHPAIGVAAPGGGVLSVPPAYLDAGRELVERVGVGRRLVNRTSLVNRAALDELTRLLPATVGFPERAGYRAVFRWCLAPAPLPEAGAWIPAEDPAVPAWLRVFGGEVLLANDPYTGDYLAGVGIKRHDSYGHELAVGTAPPARGRGLARRLVARAARRILDEGGVPTYQHAAGNVASAKVADAAGFPDRGWVSFGVGEPPVARRVEDGDRSDG